MDGTMILVFDEDGKAKIYDDTFDLTIHCETENEQDNVLAILKRRWIPCNERMPEEHESGILKTLGVNSVSDEVIVTVECGDDERMSAIAQTYDGKWHWDFKHVFSGCKIVAWMPMPEPYKEGSY